MDTGKLAHIGVEATALLALALYFQNQNKELEKRVAQLEQDVKDIAQFIPAMHTGLATHINRLASGHHPVPPPKAPKPSPDGRRVHFGHPVPDEESSEEAPPRRPRRSRSRRKSRAPVIPSSSEESSEERAPPSGSEFAASSSEDYSSDEPSAEDRRDAGHPVVGHPSGRNIPDPAATPEERRAQVRALADKMRRAREASLPNQPGQ